MLDMTMPVLFAILIAILAVITVGSLIAFRLIVEHRSNRRHRTSAQPSRTGRR